MRIFIFLLLFATLCSSCWDLQIGTPVQGIAPGTWRGAFMLENHAVPVMYEVLNTSNDKPIEVIFKTGKEELKADRVKIWGDTVTLFFDKTNTHLKLVYQIDQMDGFLYNNDNDNYPIVFAGQHAIMHRFPVVRKEPKADLTGDWTVTANVGQDSTVTGNIRFSTNENYIEGKLTLANQKVLTLEGAVQDDKIYLSGFDGKRACWLSATIADSKSLVEGSIIINEATYFWEGNAVAGVIHN